MGRLHNAQFPNVGAWSSLQGKVEHQFTEYNSLHYFLKDMTRLCLRSTPQISPLRKICATVRTCRKQLPPTHG
jgi:hypothetical protein